MANLQGNAGTAYPAPARCHVRPGSVSHAPCPAFHGLGRALVSRRISLRCDRRGARRAGYPGERRCAASGRPCVWRRLLEPDRLRDADCPGRHRRIRSGDIPPAARLPLLAWETHASADPVVDRNRNATSGQVACRQRQTRSGFGRTSACFNFRALPTISGE